jgi:hypothetical protein
MAKKEPTAFSGNDTSVYISQAMAVADLIASVSDDPSRTNERTVPEASMLVFMLLDAAQEAYEAEAEERRNAIEVAA